MTSKRDQRYLSEGTRAERLLTADLEGLIKEKIAALTNDLILSDASAQEVREMKYIQIKAFDLLLTEVKTSQKTYQHMMGNRGKS